MKNKNHIIDEQGSLGILAIGDIGLKSWREVRGDLKLPKKNGDEKAVKHEK